MSKGSPTLIGGDFGPAARELVKRVSDFIGGALRPRQIRRVAQAQADAAITAAESDIEITAMQRRAVQRMLADAERSQNNIENVVRQAIPHLSDDATPDELDDDWLPAYFEACRIVSNEEMQALWGRILAGEANQSGTFSRRTLRIASDLDKDDAEKFTSLCRFGWVLDGKFYPLVYDVDNAIYRNHGINFGTLTHFDDAGLVSFSNIAGFIRRNNDKEELASYCGDDFVQVFKKDSEKYCSLAQGWSLPGYAPRTG